MTLYFPSNATSDPRELPELRRALAEMAIDNGAWERSEIDRLQREQVRYGADRDDILAFKRAINSMQWYQEMLPTAQLIHITADLCEVLFATLDSVPDDLVLSETDPPVLNGLVVFETPFIGLDSENVGNEIRVDAMLWGPVQLPPREIWLSDADGVIPGYALASFRFMDPETHTDQAALESKAMADYFGVKGNKMWMPLGRADWCIGDEIRHPTHHGIEADSLANKSMMEDRKLAAALWALVKQKRAVTVTTTTAPRHARKRLERQGDYHPKEVQVLHLRRPEYLPRHADGSTGRKLGVRFPVRPHYRMVACGPGRSERRMVLIPPHFRGPMDAPISHIERVWEVDR